MGVQTFVRFSQNEPNVRHAGQLANLKRGHGAASEFVVAML